MKAWTYLKHWNQESKTQNQKLQIMEFLGKIFVDKDLPMIFKNNKSSSKEEVSTDSYFCLAKIDNADHLKSQHIKNTGKNDKQPKTKTYCKMLLL